MNPMPEGYIKFNCIWIKSGRVNEEYIRKLNTWRGILYEAGLIGAYPDGIGYGNLSMRFRGNSFIISGSATGGIKTLDERHYVLVKSYDFLKNEVTCSGPLKASSESLSHAAVYESSPETMAVIHVHHLLLWEKLKGLASSTNEKAQFGSPELALEIKRLFSEGKAQKEMILVMGGHPEGIIAFGRSLNEAGEILLAKMEELKSR